MDLQKNRLKLLKLAKKSLSEYDLPEETIKQLFRLVNDLQAFEIKLKKKFDLIGNEIVKGRGFLNTLRDFTEENLELLRSKISELLPETSKVVDSMVLAKLIDRAGSIEKLVLMPSSKIQILGAEKAVFRSLKENKRMPKHGIIYFDPSVMKAENKGKAARKLASEISKKVKIDYYRGLRPL